MSLLHHFESSLSSSSNQSNQQLLPPSHNRPISAKIIMAALLRHDFAAHSFGSDHSTKIFGLFTTARTFIDHNNDNKSTASSSDGTLENCSTAYVERQLF
jgi:hypothetical protein